MMNIRVLQVLGVVSVAAAVSGCVTHGNTHALITPVGIAGYHTFKPENTAPVRPPLPNPDRMAVVDGQNEQPRHDDEI